MDFLFYLTPQAQEIVNLIEKAKYSIEENTKFCKDKKFFGFVDFDKKFVICTNNIKNKSVDPHHHINETIYHEAVHIAHDCNGYLPFGISKSDMILPSNKIMDIQNSINASKASTQMEHEAYWMEDKPDKVKYVVQKYCF